MPRPPGSLLVDPKPGKVNWTSAPGNNPDGVTTLEVEVAGDTVRTFAGDGTPLLDAHLGDQPAGAIGLWVSSGAALEVLKLEVTALPPPTARPPAPLAFGDRAPVFPPARRVVRDEFGKDDPAFDRQGYGARGGHFVTTAEKARTREGRNVLHLKGDPAVPGDCDFAVEAVGRVRGGPTARWGLNLTNWPKPEPNYGVYVRLSAGGEAAVLPGVFDNTRRDTGPLVPPVRHPAILAGAEFNKVLVVSRGRELRVYVNDALVCGPVTVAGDLMSPLAVAFTAEGAESADLDRITAYSLDPPPPAPPAGPPKAAAPPPPTAGFTALFNGRDRAGWSVPVGTDPWTVENGALVARGGDGPAYLYSDRSFGDFHLRAEYRINAAGNAGLFFRTAPGRRATAGTTGYEADICPPGRPAPTGSLYRYTGAGQCERVATSPGQAGGADDWCTCEVIAVGPEVTVKVNGETASRYTDPTPTARGQFALQQFGPRTVVEFRRIEVKELEAKPAPPPASPPKAAAPKPKAFAGDWVGTWANSHGESGADNLTLRIEADGRYAGLWTGYLKLTGQAFSHDTIELQGTHQGKTYKLNGTVKNGVLGLKYLVSDSAGRGLYTGVSELKRK